MTAKLPSDATVSTQEVPAPTKAVALATVSGSKSGSLSFAKTPGAGSVCGAMKT